MVDRFLRASSKGTTSAVPNLLHLNPEMLRLLRKAAEHLEGHVTIERFREGVWGVELGLFGGLQKSGYLQLIAMRDQPSKGKVTATLRQKVEKLPPVWPLRTRDNQGPARRDGARKLTVLPALDLNFEPPELESILRLFQVAVVGHLSHREGLYFGAVRNDPFVMIAERVPLVLMP
jgi:hypothetical protein